MKIDKVLRVKEWLIKDILISFYNLIRHRIWGYKPNMYLAKVIPEIENIGEVLRFSYSCKIWGFHCFVLFFYDIFFTVYCWQILLLYIHTKKWALIYFKKRITQIFGVTFQKKMKVEENIIIWRNIFL